MSKRVPYSLPDDQCERLNRREMNAMIMLLAHLSSAAYAEKDLEHRFECIPNGKQRFRLVLGGLRAICDDLAGTISPAQCKTLYGTMKDNELRIVPKLTSGSPNLIMSKDQAKELMDAAREKCRMCTEDGESCRQCGLYQIMEALVPMENYGNGLMCPYSLAEWRD